MLFEHNLCMFPKKAAWPIFLKTAINHKWTVYHFRRHISAHPLSSLTVDCTAGRVSRDNPVPAFISAVSPKPVNKPSLRTNPNRYSPIGILACAANAQLCPRSDLAESFFCLSSPSPLRGQIRIPRVLEMSYEFTPSLDI
jgi:hypothetical protein